MPTDIDVKNWFLAPSDDLRSSNMLEIVASEFKVQGLEIDWAIVCWDADDKVKYISQIQFHKKYSSLQL